MKIAFSPTISSGQTERNLYKLVQRGAIRDPALDRAVSRLDEMYRVYCSCCPFGLWAPGLHVTSEMRSFTELYLPMAGIAGAFQRLIALSLRHEPPNSVTLFGTSPTWIDFLHRFGYPGITVNPARLLQRLMSDELSRIRFLFALFLPRRHGESFGRYPDQMSFLERRISGNPEFRHQGISCMDAACGTGEGTYDLARLLARCGIPAPVRRIHGCSAEPLEIFAAAHSSFPHDPERERVFRRITEPLVSGGGAEGILFSVDDIARPPSREDEPYDVIICNGLLGGPFLPGEAETTAAVSALSKRLKWGGVLLATDRFHGGWKRKFPPSLMGEIMKRSGLVPIPVPEGLAAEKSRGLVRNHGTFPLSPRGR